MNIDITGLPKYAVIAALWNAAKPNSWMDKRAAMSETRAREVADWLMQSKLPDDRLDWLDSRYIKADVRGDSFDPAEYDSANGDGAAARAIDRLRQFITHEVPEHGIQQKVSEMDGSPPPQVHGDGQGQARQEVLSARGGGVGPDGEGPEGSDVA